MSKRRREEAEFEATATQAVKLNPRATRGTRMTALVGEAQDDDETFWGHKTWAEDESEYSSEAEEKDKYDSDFNETESEEDEEDETTEKTLRREERSEQRRTAAAANIYQEPKKGPQKAAAKPAASAAPKPPKAPKTAAEKPAAPAPAEPKSSDAYFATFAGGASVSGATLATAGALQAVMQQAVTQQAVTPVVAPAVLPLAAVKTEAVAAAAKQVKGKGKGKATAAAAAGPRNVRASTKHRTQIVQVREGMARARAAEREPRRPRALKLAHFTQAQLLREACQTEQDSARWLQKQQRLEDENKTDDAPRQQKPYKERFLSRKGRVNYMIFPEGELLPQVLRGSLPPIPPGRAKCKITGRPARYQDPQTGFPYYDAAAFKEIRRLYPHIVRRRPKPPPPPPLPAQPQQRLPAAAGGLPPTAVPLPAQRQPSLYAELDSDSEEFAVTVSSDAAGDGEKQRVRLVLQPEPRIPVNRKATAAAAAAAAASAANTQGSASPPLPAGQNYQFPNAAGNYQHPAAATAAAAGGGHYMPANGNCAQMPYGRPGPQQMLPPPPPELIRPESLFSSSLPPKLPSPVAVTMPLPALQTLPQPYYYGGPGPGVMGWNPAAPAAAGGAAGEGAMQQYWWAMQQMQLQQQQQQQQQGGSRMAEV